MRRPLILLSNDDGVGAPGLAALRAELESFADVTVCAPSTNQSATSHKLTLSTVLRLSRIDARTFALDGTPADCVYVALHAADRLLSRWPDMVVSGMNLGPNLGVDVVYSGTVAAAREGANRGIPSVAVSADVRADRALAARLGAGVALRTWRAIEAGEGPQVPPLFNVNVPPGASWKLVATRPGRRLYDDEVVFRTDPRGREYLWIGGSNAKHDVAEGTDTAAWEQGHASITPLTLDLFEHGNAALAQKVAGEP